MSGTRYNTNKPRLGLLPPHAKTEIAKAFTMGAEKYGRHNWMTGLSFVETYDSLERHMTKWMMGEENDQESGLSHLAHAGCNIMMLLELSRLSPQYDDRPTHLSEEELHFKPKELRAHLDTKPHTMPVLLEEIEQRHIAQTELQNALKEPRPVYRVHPWVETKDGVHRCIRCLKTSDQNLETFNDTHKSCMLSTTWTAEIKNQNGTT